MIRGLFLAEEGKGLLARERQERFGLAAGQLELEWGKPFTQAGDGAGELTAGSASSTCPPRTSSIKKGVSLRKQPGNQERG